MKKKVAIQGIAGSYHDISGCYHDDQERPFRTGHDGHREYDSGKPPSKP